MKNKLTFTDRARESLLRALKAVRHTPRRGEQLKIAHAQLQIANRYEEPTDSLLALNKFYKLLAEEK